MPQLSPNMIVKHEDVCISAVYSLQNLQYKIIGFTNPDLASSLHLRDANTFRKHMFAVDMEASSSTVLLRETSFTLPLLAALPWKQVKRLKGSKLRMDQT